MGIHRKEKLGRDLISREAAFSLKRYTEINLHFLQCNALRIYKITQKDLHKHLHFLYTSCTHSRGSFRGSLDVRCNHNVAMSAFYLKLMLLKTNAVIFSPFNKLSLLLYTFIQKQT